MGGIIRASRRGAWISSIILSLGSAYGQIGDPTQDQMGRLSLAEAWAPVIFQDMASDRHPGVDGFEPSDALVDIFFFDSQSVKENDQAIFRVGRQDWAKVFGQPPVYFSVIETRSHFYLNYFLYHALDTNMTWHAHDTENIWVILKKNNGLGELEGVVTNAHGRPMIHGVSAEMQKVAESMKSKSRFLKFFDRNSKAHQAASEIEFIDRGNSKSIKLFSAMMSHGIYKFSSQAPLSNATIYYPKSCNECFDSIKGYRNPQIGYNLVDFDGVMESVRHDPQLADKQDAIFVRIEEDRVYASAAYEDRGLPNYLAPSWSEQGPAANLFFVTSFRTPYSLADPAAVHSYLMKSNSQISSDYIYNYYLQPVESTVVKAQQPVLFKSASVWGFATLLFK